MRRFCVGLAATVIAILTIAGCGSSDDGVAEKTSAPETTASTATSSMSATSATSATSTTKATTTTKPSTGSGWTTVATLRSTDSPWKDMKGILVSEPFTAKGDVQVVLDMPNAGDVDGVIAAIIPADKATDTTSLLGAILDGAVVTMIAMKPTKVVSGLDGTYVLVNSVPASKAWSLDVQTRP